MFPVIKEYQRTIDVSTTLVRLLPCLFGTVSDKFQLDPPNDFHGNRSLVLTMTTAAARLILTFSFLLEHIEIEFSSACRPFASDSLEAPSLRNGSKYTSSHFYSFFFLCSVPGLSDGFRHVFPFL